jgi:hypothetical protein
VKDLLDKFTEDVAPEHIFCITPKLKRIVSPQTFGQIGHAFYFVGLWEFARTQCSQSVGEEMIKV